MSEFHDLAELALNSDGQMWGNLGSWKDQKDYSGACRALAVLLGDAVDLDQSSIVMDVGFGCGDQLLLWLQRYKVGGVYGINYSHSQTAMARQRLQDAGYAEEAMKLHHGDAADPKDWGFGDIVDRANKLLVLDCAYHFSSRSRFLNLARRNLAADGRIGLTDFITANGKKPKFRDRWILKTMLRLSRIPGRNIREQQHYVQELKDAGFSDILIEDISIDVMPCFAVWWRNYRQTADAHALSLSNRLKYGVTAWFLGWAYRKNILRYCLITATNAKSAL